jgi:hypothetical protein
LGLGTESYKCLKCFIEGHVSFSRGLYCSSKRVPRNSDFRDDDCQVSCA